MTFTAAQLLALLPLLLTAGAMAALMLAIAWRRCVTTAYNQISRKVNQKQPTR